MESRVLTLGRILMAKPPDLEAFASRLNKAMLKAGHISPKFPTRGDPGAIAKVADVSYEMGRRYVEGVAMPRGRRLSKVAKWLGVSAGWLQYGEGVGNAFASVDHVLLEKCVTAVQEAQAEYGKLTPEQSARLVVYLYEESAEGKEPSGAEIQRAMKLLAPKGK